MKLTVTGHLKKLKWNKGIQKATTRTVKRMYKLTCKPGCEVDDHVAAVQVSVWLVCLQL